MNNDFRQRVLITTGVGVLFALILIVITKVIAPEFDNETILILALFAFVFPFLAQS